MRLESSCYVVGDMDSDFTSARLVTRRIFIFDLDFIYEMDLMMEVGRSDGTIPSRGVNHFCRTSFQDTARLDQIDVAALC